MQCVGHVHVRVSTRSNDKYGKYGTNEFDFALEKKQYYSYSINDLRKYTTYKYINNPK